MSGKDEKPHQYNVRISTTDFAAAAIILTKVNEYKEKTAPARNTRWIFVDMLNATDEIKRGPICLKRVPAHVDGASGLITENYSASTYIFDLILTEYSPLPDEEDNRVATTSPNIKPDKPEPAQGETKKE